MNVSPMISIITVVRNAPKGLAATAASVLGQDHHNYEWIIKDGASTRDTLDVLDSLREHAIAISEPDSGIYQAMNIGISHASGKYLLFLNAGDTLVTSSTLGAATRQLQMVDCPDIAFFDTILSLRGGQLQRSAKEPRRYIRYGMPSLHQSILYKRTHKLSRYDERLRICGDYDFTIQNFLGADRFAVVPMPLAIFEVGGTSYQNWPRLVTEAAAIQRKYFNTPPWRLALDASRRVATHFGLALLSNRPHLSQSVVDVGEGNRN